MTVELDKDGKILIPEEIRKQLMLTEKDCFNIKYNEHQIILELITCHDWIEEDRLAREKKILGNNET